ncbi:MAG: substrate-binding domain-containing protein, partial [Lachnospiraceae bacterium]|nr:substrate-binding domain-containing protein [Lachnospiraceae bacterium]
MKKKLVAAFLCVAMAATLLAGCGSSSSSTSTETTEETTDDAEETAEEVVEEAADAVDLSDAYVAVFYYTFSDTYTSSVRAALDGYLDELGVDYEDFDGNNSATTQNEQVDTAIAAGADLLIVYIVTSGSVDSSQQIVPQAGAADLPSLFGLQP